MIIHLNLILRKIQTIKYLIQQNKIKFLGIDLTSPRYSGENGWENFQLDLHKNEQFNKQWNTLLDQDEFWTEVKHNIQSDLAWENGGKTEVQGYSWFQKFLSTLPTK